MFDPTAGQERVSAYFLAVEKKLSPNLLFFC
jgi:hypothetical protein